MGDVVRDIEAGFGRLQVPTGYRISASMDGAAHADYFPGHVPARHQLAFERRIQRQSVTASCWHAGLADRGGIRC